MAVRIRLGGRRRFWVMLREALKLYERATNAGSIRDVIAAQQNVVSILSLLGFSPTARARMGLAKVTTVSKLEQLRQQARPDRV